MRWGMHKWFLVGFFMSGVIVAAAIFVAWTYDVSPPLVASCACGLILATLLRRRRSPGYYERMLRSRELRCRFPDELSQKLRRLANSQPRARAIRYC